MSKEDLGKFINVLSQCATLKNELKTKGDEIIKDFKEALSNENK